MSVDPPILAGETFTMIGGGVPGDVGPQGPIGPVGPIGPKGDPGGWVTASLIANDVNLNTLTTPGTYYRNTSVGTTAALNYPKDGWAGWVEVVGYVTSVLQRATSFTSAAGTAPTQRNVWFRTYVGGSWAPWARIDVGDHEAAADPHPQYLREAPVTLANGSNVNTAVDNGVFTVVGGLNIPSAFTGGNATVINVLRVGTVVVQRAMYLTSGVTGDASATTTWVRASTDTGANYSPWTKDAVWAQPAVASSIADGTNINTLTAPGSYFRSSSVGVTTALNYPVADWAGWLVVDSNANGASVIQRAYSIYSGNGASSVYRSVYWRTIAGGAWGAWVRMSVDLRDVGSPEGVVHAAVGETYVDTATTNGAREWYKNAGTGPTGWVVKNGDTGNRSVPAVASAGFTATTSLWRRIGNTVSVSLLLRADAASTAGGSAITIPTGFRPAANLYFSPPYSGVGLLSFAPNGAGVLGNALAANDQRYWTVTYLTADSWPTTLPGTAV